MAAVLVGWASFQGHAIDAWAYWSNRPPLSYDLLPGADGAFTPSPAFAHLLSPLTALPWQVFLALWLVALIVTAAWLVGPLLLFPTVLLLGIEIHYANIHFLVAAAMVLGFRYPWTWAFVLLTKVTPGVGLIWFVRRREWRSLTIVLGVTAIFAVASFAVDPQSWLGWFRLIQQSAVAPDQAYSSLIPLWLRLPIATALVWWGARRNARWTVPVAALIAMPVIWAGSLAVLAGIVPLLEQKWLRPGWRAALA